MQHILLKVILWGIMGPLSVLLIFTPTAMLRELITKIGLILTSVLFLGIVSIRFIIPKDIRIRILWFIQKHIVEIFTKKDIFDVVEDYIEFRIRKELKDTEKFNNNCEKNFDKL